MKCLVRKRTLASLRINTDSVTSVVQLSVLGYSFILCVISLTGCFHLIWHNFSLCFERALNNSTASKETY